MPTKRKSPLHRDFGNFSFLALNPFCFCTLFVFSRLLQAFVIGGFLAVLGLGSARALCAARGTPRHDRLDPARVAVGERVLPLQAAGEDGGRQQCSDGGEEGRRKKEARRSAFTVCSSHCNGVTLSRSAFTVCSFHCSSVMLCRLHSQHAVPTANDFRAV